MIKEVAEYEYVKLDSLVIEDSPLGNDGPFDPAKMVDSGLLAKILEYVNDQERSNFDDQVSTLLDYAIVWPDRVNQLQAMDSYWVSLRQAVQSRTTNFSYVADLYVPVMKLCAPPEYKGIEREERLKQDEVDAYTWVSYRSAASSVLKKAGQILTVWPDLRNGLDLDPLDRQEALNCYQQESESCTRDLKMPVSQNYDWEFSLMELAALAWSLKIVFQDVKVPTFQQDGWKLLRREFNRKILDPNRYTQENIQLILEVAADIKKIAAEKVIVGEDSLQIIMPAEETTMPQLYEIPNIRRY